MIGAGLFRRFFQTKKSGDLTDLQIAQGVDALFDQGGRETALKVGAVFRATRLISNSVGKLPLNVYQGTAKGRRKAIEHPAYRLLRRKASSELGAKTFKETLTAHALLRGNGFAFIKRDSSRRPMELIPLDPEATTAARENGALIYVTYKGGQSFRLQPYEVFHVRGLGWDGLTGWGILDYAETSTDVAAQSQKYQKAFFKNSARPSVVLECPNKLDSKMFERLRTQWDTVHSGADNAHKVAILEGGMKLNPFSINAKDAQLVESMKFSITDIANWFGLPPHKLGSDAKSSYNSLEQENQSFLDECLDNWLVTWEEEAWDKLLSEDEKNRGSHFVEFNRAALVRADLNARSAYYQKALGGAAWMTINEVRRRENQNDADGDLDYSKVIQPSNNFQSAPTGGNA